MKVYNIFYKNKKINNSELKEEQVQEIIKNCKNGMIRLNIDNNINDVPLRQLQIVKCTIV
jgi:ribosomal protein S3AE